MSNTFQKMLAFLFLSMSTVLMAVHCSTPATEAKANEAIKASPDSSNDLSDGPGVKVIYDEGQRIMAFVDAFEHYSDKKMENVISQTYDENVLKEKSAKEIRNEMASLIQKLKGASFEKTIFESPQRVSLKLTKNDSVYFLDIFLSERTRKITKIKIARLG